MLTQTGQLRCGVIQWLGLGYVWLSWLRSSRPLTSDILRPLPHHLLWKWPLWGTVRACSSCLTVLKEKWEPPSCFGFMEYKIPKPALSAPHLFPWCPELCQTCSLLGSYFCFLFRPSLYILDVIKSVARVWAHSSYSVDSLCLKGALKILAALP